jgi:hypothetical protein
MGDRSREKSAGEAPEANPNEPIVMDAIRHVGPTLEAEGTFLPTGELPENRIEAEGLTENESIGAVAKDEYDREAEIMGAERLLTRLPGDTSSDPHTDTVADNAATMDTDRKRRRKGRAA